MKPSKNLFSIILLIICTIGFIPLVTAQKNKVIKAREIKNLIETQQFVFKAQFVTPMNGRQRFLTSDYPVSISKDTITGDLPYFGRAYAAPINPTEGGIRFTSTNFDYKKEERKKGSWDISIKPKDVSDVQLLTLSVFENGNSALQVISTNRQPISFNGFIEAKKANL